MRLWQGLRRFAEEKSPFGFFENHLRSVPPFQTASPGATVSGRLENITEHIIQAPNLRKWARIVIDPLYDYIYIILWGMICNHCVPSKKYLYIYIYIYMSNGLNLLHPRKDAAEMVIVFCVSPIVPEGLVFVGMK